MQGFLCSVGWGRVVTVSVSVLVDCPFPGPLAKDRELFGLFWSAFVGLSRLPAFPSTFSGMYGKNKTQGTHCHIVCWVSRSCDGLLPSLLLSESVC